MKGIARISYRDGLLLLPAKTPYELEIMSEHVNYFVRREGKVQLRLNGRDWLVKMANGEVLGSCMHCREPLRKVSYAKRERVLCASCARRESA